MTAKEKANEEIINGLNEPPFTEQEREIMDLIIKAHNIFVKLDNRHHVMEMQEWVSGVHQLQSVMSHRVLSRLFPEYFN